MPQEIVKVCPYCQTPFSLDDLSSNPVVKLIGMSFIDESVEEAFYFFEHDLPDCGTSFMVCVNEFTELLAEPTPSDKLSLQKCGHEHCMTIVDLAVCTRECYFAPFRRLLIRMLEQKSRAAAQCQTPSTETTNLRERTPQKTNSR